ncbi:30S ribosomal protein S17 [Paraliomyxa miuraensis]|uniref:30S ribosomal protein S17 n=1 Tax=Paraliomyxa miuraensis TaxID=376150 RepID=UPI002250AF64|nr:30S ribosomal protein S17 [Paraliomyxa miuraensis]MCX4241286.1 30S ribosomal protein S17 [Paraliomyxa miuraensis]
MSDSSNQANEADGGRLERHRRVLVGTVVSDKMDKTIVVQVMRRYRHPQYRKYVNERVKYKAHDERNEARIGDTVRIIESRPMSRDKRWRLQAVTERAPVV